MKSRKTRHPRPVCIQSPLRLWNGPNDLHSYTEDNRFGDHIWYISNVRKFQSHYPAWKYKYDMRGILQEIFEAQAARMQA